MIFKTQIKKIINFFFRIKLFCFLNYISYLLSKLILFIFKFNEKISIIMPIYNCNKFSQSLNSLKNQSYKNIEIIIVNDNSNNKFTKKLEKKIKNLKLNIIYHKNNKNFGPYKSRNIGAKLASGNVVAFQDSDDFSDKHRILIQYIFLKIFKNYHANYILHYRVKNFKELIKYNDLIVRRCPVTLMIYKNFFLKLGGFKYSKKKFGYDSHFIKELHAKNKIALYPLVLYKANFSLSSYSLSKKTGLIYKFTKKNNLNVKLGKNRIH